MKPKIRARLKLWMKKRMSFRLHMSLIMFSTIFLGMVSNFVMLNTFGVTHPALRYPLTVILAYGWFLLFIRIYVRSILLKSASTANVLDFIDPTPNFSSGSSFASSSIPWKGGGGSFSGGGSTGDWGAAEAVVETATEATVETAASAIDDEGSAIFVLVIGGIVAAIIFGSGAYFIWHSPEILSECLLQVIMVSGMRKRMKKFSEAEWLLHMFQVTRWPVLVVLIVSLLSGALVRVMCPDANNIRELRMRCWKR